LPVASIFAVRYMSAVGVAAILYDHALTFSEEVRVIWSNSEVSFWSRISFMVNRYTTEAMIVYVAHMLGGNGNGITGQDCQRFIWVFGVVGSVSIATQQFMMTVRLYTIWDRREKIKWILSAGFAIQSSLTTVFSILTARDLQPFVIYFPQLHMCGIISRPWTLPVTIGTLSAFQIFMILMAIGNALDRPYQKQAEIVTTLIRDGVRMFICLFLLSLVNFVMTVAGNPSDCLVTLAVVWAMYGIVHARMQLRVEGLRFVRFTFPLNNAIELEGVRS